MTIHKNEYACCGANGSWHESRPFTFDLKQKKILRLKDIIKEKNYELINKIILEKMNKYEAYFKETNYIGYFVEITSEKARIYCETSRSRGKNISVDFEYDKYPDLFEKSFLSRIAKK